MGEAIFGTLGVVVAAFAIWLTVRVANRSKRRWWIWCIVIFAAFTLAYSLGFGPFVAYSESPYSSSAAVAVISPFYLPMYSIADSGAEPFRSAINWYVHCCRGLSRK